MPIDTVIASTTAVLLQSTSAFGSNGFLREAPGE
jgi:hypothetical protein